MPGDSAGDAVANLHGFVVAADFRKPAGERLCPPSGTSPGSDLNADGSVDILDLVLVAQAIGRG